MELRWKRILGQLQSLGENSVDAYLADSMGVFITKQPMSFHEVEHIHRGFEFIMKEIKFKQSGYEGKSLGRKTFSQSPWL